MNFLKKVDRRFLNSKGFSLSELMVSVAVSVLVSTVATFAFLMAFDVYIRMVRLYDAEVEMSSLMQNLRSTFATAVYTRYGGPASAANNAATNRGAGNEDVSQGRLFSITDAAVPGGGSNYIGDAFLIGLFNREMMSAANQSDLAAVQITYQRPNAAANLSGAVYIDTERNPVAGGGWVRLNPVNAPQMFTRLTNFEIDNVKVYDTDGSIVNVTAAGGTPCAGASTCVGNPVVSAEVNMVMRYYTLGNVQDWKWCNLERNGIAGCTLTTFAKFYDLERKMNVVFVNNAYQRGEYLPRRPFGNVYFFSPWLPLQKGP